MKTENVLLFLATCMSLVILTKIISVYMVGGFEREGRKTYFERFCCIESKEMGQWLARAKCQRTGHKFWVLTLRPQPGNEARND